MSNGHSRHFIWLLLALACFSVFTEIGRRDIVTENEGQRATPPAEMLRNDQFMIPTINGQDYLAKPPLLYWAIAGVYALTGVISPAIARTPTALSFIVLVLAVYLITRRRAGEMTARWAAVALLLSPYAFERARCAQLDIPLTLAVFGAIVAFRAACLSPAAPLTAGMTILAGLSLGAAILLKGPAPILFLVPACLAQLILNGRPDAAWRRPAIRGTVAVIALSLLLWLGAAAIPSIGAAIPFPAALILIAALWTTLAWRHSGPGRARIIALWALVFAIGLATAAPWGLLMVREKGWPFITGLIHSEALDRTHTATRINSGPPFYYLLALPLMFAPWGLLFIAQFSRRHWEQATPLYRFSVLTAWMSIILFSLIAGKEYEYVLPAAPFLMIATGHHLAALSGGRCQAPWERWARRWLDAMLGLGALLAIVGAAYILLFQFHPMLAAEAFLLTAAALLLAYLAHRHPTRRPICLAGLALCVVMMGMLSQAYHFTGERSFKTVATTAGRLHRAGHNIEAVRMTSAFDVYPGFAFYAQTDIPTLLTPNTVRAKLQGAQPYYCALRGKLLPDIPKEWVLVGPHRKGVVLLGNRPLPEAVEAPQ